MKRVLCSQRGKKHIRVDKNKFSDFLFWPLKRKLFKETGALFVSRKFLSPIACTGKKYFAYDEA